MPKQHPERVMHSSDNPDWRTPPAMFAALDREFHFDWDAAADRASSLTGHHYFGPGSQHQKDGIKATWHELTAETGHITATLFMNPPYSRRRGQPIEPWIQKACTESKQGTTVVGVVPASIQTEWWMRWVWGRAHEVRFIPHRVSFLRADGTEADNAGGNTAVVVWRPLRGYVKFHTAVNYWTWRDEP